MPVQESCPRHDRVSREAKPRGEGMAAAQPRDQGAEKKEDSDVGAQCVHRADATLGSRQFRPVTRARDSGRSGRCQPGSDQQCRAAACQGSSSYRTAHGPGPLFRP